MNEKIKLRNDLIRISILEEEVALIKSRYTPTDTGHLRTTVGVLEDRIRELKNQNEPVLTGPGVWGQGFC